MCSLMYREYCGEWRKYLESKGISCIVDADYRVNG